MNSDRPNLAQQLGHANAMRSAARLAAVQALYQMDVAGTDLNDVLREFEANYFSGAVDEDGEVVTPSASAGEGQNNAIEGGASDQQLLDHGYMADILQGVLRTQSEIDPLIDEQLREGWRLNRIDSTLRAILRAGTYELRARDEISVAVIIDEYLNIAHAFFEQDEPKVVNGVLDKLAQRVRLDDG